MKNDKYRRVRGGWSRILEIQCEHCEQHICFYQKDGPGQLRRMYLDRIEGLTQNSDKLICPHCDRILGVKIIYEKEDRPAYRLFVGAVIKKIVKSGHS